MDLKNWYDRVREQLDRLDFPALWAGFAPCPFALYTHDTAVLNGEVMPRPAEFYGNTSVCRQGEYLAIWNMEADSFSNAVRVHIATLRKKLKQALSYDPIVTRIGQGYCLSQEESL